MIPCVKPLLSKVLAHPDDAYTHSPEDGQDVLDVARGGPVQLPAVEVQGGGVHIRLCACTQTELWIPLKERACLATGTNTLLGG